jgi:hypothetical protein
MKIIWIFLIVLILSPTNSLAKKWSIGDSVSVRSICKYERDILLITRADTHSKAAVLNIMNSMISVGRCIVFPVHIHFKVEQVIITYKDFRKRNSAVLKVYMMAKKSFKGYVIAQEDEDFKV